MKIKTLIVIFALLNFTVSPKGVWVYKPDSTRIKINTLNGILSGKLISSKNPNNEPGTEILKDFIYQDGEWQGKFFITSKDRWVEANLFKRRNLLFIELDMGHKIKIIQWHKEKSKKL